MSKREIIWIVKAAALLIFFAMAFMGQSKFVNYLGFIGICIFCLYCVFTTLKRSSARSADEKDPKKETTDEFKNGMM